MENFRKILLGLLVIVIISAGLYYQYKREKNVENNQVIDLNNLKDSSYSGVQGTGKFTVEKVDISTIKVPNLDRPIIFTSDMPSDARTIMTKKINDLVVLLKKDPASFENWLKLAQDRKIISDYLGAVEIWEYLTLSVPTDPTSFVNLGEVYQYYLKDNIKAEKNMLATIKIKPDYIAGYRALYNLYALSYKEKSSEAPKILLKGLAANPKSVDLMVLLAEYYRDSGDKTNAVIYYDKAIAELAATGDNTRLSSVQAERDNLK